MTSYRVCMFEQGSRLPKPIQAARRGQRFRGTIRKDESNRMKRKGASPEPTPGVRASVEFIDAARARVGRFHELMNE